MPSDKGKNKVYLCLTTHYAMKKYAVFNEAPRHENILGEQMYSPMHS
jgi:hypothetical protein